VANEINIKYRIIETNEKEHTIVVRYYTDFLDEEALKIDDNRTADDKPVRCRTDYNLTLWDHIVKSEEDLQNFIISSMPVAWFQLQYNIMNDVNKEKMAFVSKFSDKVFEKTVDAITIVPEIEKPIDPKSFTPDEIERILSTQT
jgi:hypothetical protein